MKSRKCGAEGSKKKVGDCWRSVYLWLEFEREREMDAKKRNGVQANLPPSKRLQSYVEGPLPPDMMEEEDEDVFLEETLLRDEELDNGVTSVAARFVKWRRPALHMSGTQSNSIGTHSSCL